MTKMPLVTSVIAILIAVPASAQGNGQRGANFIANWDVSNTGYVTLEDMQTRRGDLFDMFDQDGSGYLETDELAEMAETVAMQDASRAERQAEQRAERQQGRGQGRNANPTGEVVHDAMSLEFNDADGDGRISKPEFLAATKRLFDMLDVNGDGRLDLSDF